MGCRRITFFILLTFINIFLFPLKSYSIFNLESATIQELKKMKYLPGRILVTFNEGVPENIKNQLHKKLGALSVKESYGNYFHIVSVPEDSLEEMLNLYNLDPSVKYAEPEYFRFISFIPNDELYQYQWNFTQINLPLAWNISTGSGVTIAVVDTGVSPNGTDGFGYRLILGYNFIKNNKDASDDNGHGTHVAGTIAQETNNLIGCSGIAYNAYILAVKVLNKRGVGLSSEITNGIRWAADHGADIINLSLGAPTISRTENAAIEYAYNKGIVICAASGNESENIVNYPAAHENCIAVGATRYDMEIAPYSNFGDSLDIVAPGGDTSVDQNNDGYPDGILQETFQRFLTFYNWAYYFFQGTSMATPHVSGLAALILSVHPEYSPEEVRNVIQSTARDLGNPGWDPFYGWGLIDTYAALSKIK